MAGLVGRLALLVLASTCLVLGCGDGGGGGSTDTASGADTADGGSDTTVAVDTTDPPDSASSDTETPQDTTVGQDTQLADTSIESDTGSDAADVPMDFETTVTLPLDGFGTLSGGCDQLNDAKLTMRTPFLIRNELNFGTNAYDAGDLGLLTAGGQEIINDGDAGDPTLMTKVFAYEVLHRCELAALVKSESEIVYATTGSTTDFLTDFDGVKLGVATTRAAASPASNPYTDADATATLEAELGRVLDSTANVSTDDAWTKQILVVMAYSAAHADTIEAAWLNLSDAMRADTIVVVTVTSGSDAFLYP